MILVDQRSAFLYPFDKFTIELPQIKLKIGCVKKVCETKFTLSLDIR